MSSAAMAGSSGSKRILVVILAIIGIAAIVVAIMFFVAPTDLPHLLFSKGEPRTGHHLVRAAVSAAVGVIALVAAALVGRNRRP